MLFGYQYTERQVSPSLWPGGRVADSDKNVGEVTYSLWTAPHSTWKPSLEGVTVTLAPRRQAGESESVSRRVKAFETSINPEALVRRVY